MGRRLKNFVLLILLLLGLSLFFYPLGADLWNRHTQSQAIRTLSSILEEIPEENLWPMWDAAAAYNQSLGQNTFPADAFGDPMSDLQDSNYNQLLNPQGSGIMGYISIPKIRQSIPIYHGASKSVLQIAAGHIHGTALPVGGSGTHCVIAAHRGLPSARLFTDLDQLEPGDKFYLHILDQVLAYQVDQILPMVEKHDYVTLQSALQRIPGEDHVTLFTCTPYGINSHRLLVRGARTESLGEEDIPSRASDSAQILRISSDFLLISELFALLSLAGILFRQHKKRINGKVDRP